jgi:ferric-dicitrate binding protein FerR (iron transport regulator)
MLAKKRQAASAPRSLGRRREAAGSAARFAANCSNKAWWESPSISVQVTPYTGDGSPKRFIADPVQNHAGYIHFI